MGIIRSSKLASLYIYMTQGIKFPRRHLRVSGRKTTVSRSGISNDLNFEIAVYRNMSTIIRRQPSEAEATMITNPLTSSPHLFPSTHACSPSYAISSSPRASCPTLHPPPHDPPSPSPRPPPGNPAVGCRSHNGFCSGL